MVNSLWVYGVDVAMGGIEAKRRTVSVLTACLPFRAIDDPFGRVSWNALEDLVFYVSRLPRGLVWGVLLVNNIAIEGLPLIGSGVTILCL